MGWGRFLLLGNLGQQMDIADQQEEIERLKRRMQSSPAGSPASEERLQSLQRENDELKLYLAVVLRLLVAKNVATADEIKALIAAIDREDGIEDKKHGGPIVPQT